MSSNKTNKLFKNSLQDACPNYLNNLLHTGDFYEEGRDLMYVEKRIQTVDIRYAFHQPKPDVK